MEQGEEEAARRLLPDLQPILAGDEDGRLDQWTRIPIVWLHSDVTFLSVVR